MIIIDNKFNYGDIVYHKTDKDQNPRMVIGVALSSCSHNVRYNVSFGGIEIWCNEIELTAEQNTVLSIGGSIQEQK